MAGAFILAVPNAQDHVLKINVVPGQIDDLALAQPRMDGDRNDGLKPGRADAQKRRDFPALKKAGAGVVFGVELNAFRRVLCRLTPKDGL
ncbi:MAG TPA: hypothetical protein VNK24_09755 [Elusimicrobiota bacterium]|nr:hypothetical protein [Elusimicrobiota bacterium]